MVEIRLLVVAFVLVAHTGWCQPAAANRALRALEKERWERSRSALDKAWRKDSAAVATLHAHSRYYFHAANPAYDLDTAHLFAMWAQDAPPGRRGPDSLLLAVFHQKIDSAAFARARDLHSANAYEFFLDHYEHAAQCDTARLLLHEVAWNDAVALNTPEAFDQYLTRYPESAYAGKANARREELLFKTRTKDQRLESFETFLSEYPDSPYRHIVEEQILEIFTADGTTARYAAFLRRYRTGSAARKAANILYHLTLETGGAAGHLFYDASDSLARITALNAAVLVPFISEKKFGFMDTSGRQVLAAEAPVLHEEYRCGGIREDILVHDNKVVARDGTVLFSGPVSELHDMGFGFLGIATPGCYRVMHKSGFTVGNACVQDAMVLEGRFVAVADADRWSLFTLTGRELTSGWDAVKPAGAAIALQKDGQWHLVGFGRLGLVADRQPLGNLESFDDIAIWPGNRVWVKRGAREAVLDENLEVEIPLGEHRLYPEVFGARCVTEEGTSLFVGPRQSAYFDEVRIHSDRIAVSRAGKWHLYNHRSDSCSAAYDSISFVGVFPAGHFGDTVRIFFDDGVYRDFLNTPLRFIPGRDASAYLQAGSNRLALYNRNGNMLFEGTYDALQHAGGNYFIVSRREKKGVVTADGKQLLPVAYDAIGDVDGDRIPLLRNMNFGMYSITSGKEIRPAYEKNIVPYSTDALVVWQKGKCGIIDFTNRVRIPIRYDAFRFWNDTAAWTRDGGTWKIMNLREGVVHVDNIDDFNIVSESDKEIIVIARRGSDFGVLSSTRGVVIPVEYTEIVNVGTPETPLFFAEKHVREADLSVIIYYDAQGKAVRHQALEPEAFDRLYCNE